MNKLVAKSAAALAPSSLMAVPAFAQDAAPGRFA
jgi:hypothetical protein